MTQDQTERAKAALAMHHLLAGGWVAQIIYTAAELGLADHFGEDAQDVASLASATATHPPSLSRLLRALADVGILHETEDRRYTLTALGATLRTDRPGRTGVFLQHRRAHARVDHHAQSDRTPPRRICARSVVQAHGYHRIRMDPG